MINATRAKMKALREEDESLKEAWTEKRAALSQAESDYAASVWAIRTDFDALQQKLRKSLEDPQVKIALRVMATNYESSTEWTTDRILASVRRRLERVEEEVFSESIPLQVDPNGSLYVNVVVGNKTARMVVDSGATLISLPARTAADLGIKVPVDAPKLQLILADGRLIPARRVTLSKVRVGQFEADNIDAAVLDATATGAEPLLGMSYLGNFKFEVNAPEKSLKMLRVETE